MHHPISNLRVLFYPTPRGRKMRTALIKCNKNKFSKAGSRDKTTSSKKLWLTQSELIEIIDNIPHKETKAIALLCATTGLQYADLIHLKWSGFTHFRNEIFVKGLIKRIPKQATELLLELRENAVSDNQRVFKTLYKKAWHRASRSFYKCNISQTAGVFKILKWTYARTHYEVFRSKTKLKQAMNLTTTRYFPAEIFNFKQQSIPCLMQF